MDIGFIGLGRMGAPMARRLIEAKHSLTVFDTQKAAVDRLVALGAQAASSPKDVADRVETVMVSLPSLQVTLEVATGKDGVIEGRKVKRLLDLSTTGSQMAVRIHDLLAKRNIVQLDSPVSGGISGAEKGTLAVMVSGPKDHYEAVKPAIEAIGRPFFISTKPGAGQTMKLANNFLSATAMVATSEAVAMGVKSGLDPKVMIEVINSGSGMNTASRDKFPRSVLPRSFDFGFTTAMMVKDVGLAVQEMRSLGMSMEVAEAVGPALGGRPQGSGPGIRFHLGDEDCREGGGNCRWWTARRRDGEVSFVIARSEATKQSTSPLVARWIASLRSQ